VELMNTEENEESIFVPSTVFTEGSLRQVMEVSMIFTLRLLGLELRQVTPDLSAIDHFLRFRYNYWTDDMMTSSPRRRFLPRDNVCSAAQY
jgi:hypothetical protein